MGAVVALVAASVGVIAAIEQLTLRARLRRTAELAQALSGHEDDPERRTVLRSIHDVAVARLVSGWLLPSWQFSEFAVWVVIGPVALAWSLARFGLTSTTATSAIICFVIIAIPARRFVRLFLERQRVAREYLAGQTVTPPQSDMLHQMEGGTLAEFGVGLVIATSLSVTATGVGTLLHLGVSAPGWALLVICGLLVGVWPVTWLRARAVRPLATNSAPGKHSTGAP
jgi:hypothetical protein